MKKLLSGLILSMSLMGCVSTSSNECGHVIGNELTKDGWLFSVAQPVGPGSLGFASLNADKSKSRVLLLVINDTPDLTAVAGNPEFKKVSECKYMDKKDATVFELIRDIPTDVTGPHS